MKTGSLVLWCLCAASLPAAYADAPASSTAAVSALQQGESSVQGSRDKDGCTLTHVTTTRFTPVGVDGHRNPDSLNLILRETFEQGDSDCSEQSDGKVTVQAMSYDPDFKDPKPLWSFTSQGWDGTAEPDGHWALYRVTMPGCCGGSDTDTYFSLWDGKRLFASTGTILSIYLSGSRTLRFVGLMDNAASMSFPEASGGAEDAVGVLSLSSDKEAGDTLVIHGHKGEGYHYADLQFLMHGKHQGGNELDLNTKGAVDDPKQVTGFSIRGKLECECDRPVLVFEVPVVDGHFSLKGAKASDPAVGFSLSPTP